MMKANCIPAFFNNCRAIKSREVLILYYSVAVSLHYRLQISVSISSFQLCSEHIHKLEKNPADGH